MEKAYKTCKFGNKITFAVIRDSTAFQKNQAYYL